MDENDLKLQQYRDTPGDIVFGPKWFKKHQQKLLFLLNNPITKIWFRWCMRIRLQDIALHEKITEINTSNFSYGDAVVLADFLVFKDGHREILDRSSKRHQKLEHKLEIKKGLVNRRTTDFRTHDKFSKRLYFAFKPIWYAMHFLDWAMLERVEVLTRFDFGFSTLTKYPGSIGANNPVDGYVRRTGVNESWSSIRTGAGNASDYTGTQAIIIGIQSTTTSNQYQLNVRSIYLFDTSALTAGATVTAGDFSIAGSGDAKDDTAGWAPTIDVYAATPASDTALANTDYGNTGTTSYTGTPLTYAGWINTANSYNNFTTFNSTGLAAISKTGNTKLSVKNANYDANNSAPTWSSNKLAYVFGYYSDQTGTAGDPKLVVTYTTEVTTTKTITGVARVTATTTKTETGVARITATTSKTETGKASVLKSASQTETGKGRIQKSVSQTETGTGRITAVATKTISGVANIRNTTLKTETGTARIEKAATQTETGKARIQISTTKTITGLARVTATTDQTIQGKARMTATTPRTINGVANVQNDTNRTETGTARIQKSVSQTIAGVSNIVVTATQTITGKARVTATALKIATGKARLEKSAQATETGVGRIEKSVTKTEQGVARITAITPRTATGKARITAMTARTETGVSRVDKSQPRTITGTATISGLRQATITGVARIVPVNFMRKAAVILGTITDRTILGTRSVDRSVLL